LEQSEGVKGSFVFFPEEDQRSGSCEAQAKEKTDPDV
jgi:hypothetical protein